MSALLFADERSWFSVPAANEPTVTPPIMNPRIMIMTIHRKYRRFDEIGRLGFLKSKYAQQRIHRRGKHHREDGNYIEEQPKVCWARDAFDECKRGEHGNTRNSRNQAHYVTDPGPSPCRHNRETKENNEGYVDVIVERNAATDPVSNYLS